jgi:AraC family transcriptional regulator
MYYLRALEKTFKYIEANMNKSFSVEDLCFESGFSRHHYSRLFHIFTGHTLIMYVKNRRLTEAAQRLVNTNDKIIDIALDYQFSSQESFTRSFTNTFKVSPGRYRRRGVFTLLQKPINVENLVVVQGGNEVKPVIKEVGPLNLMGLVYEGKNQNQEIAQVWNQFIGRSSEIKEILNPSKFYGMCEPLEENLEDIDLDHINEFKYLACVQVEDSKNMPQGMTYWEIPKRKYLVFTHIGSPQALGETYKAIYSKWIPESGYEVLYAHDFELYDENFNPESEASKMYIYIPIK